MTETRAARSTLPDGVRYRHLLLATTGLVYLTVLLGVSTRATGAGLACNANWPLCDGGLLNLFPASVPSAFEWIHRVVAGVTGIFILGTALAAWRGHAHDRRVRWAVTVGLLLLPVQILLGRETVLSFAPPILALHYWTAMAIYGSLVVATIGAGYGALDRRHVGAAIGIAAVLVPLQTVLAPPVVVRYTPPIQALQYAVVLLIFAALLLATIAGWRRVDVGATRYVLALAAVVSPFVVFLARQRIVHPELAAAHVAATTLLFATVALAAVLFLRAPSGTGGGR